MQLRHISVALIALLASACSQQDKKARIQERAVVGEWHSDTLPAVGNSARRSYRLRVRDDGMAELARYAVSSDSVVERGTWDGADSLLRVVVRGDGATSRRTSILLAVRGANTLGQVQFDSAQWGAGLAFHRK
jgi:hypothetical protein